MALLLKHQTAAEFVARFREAYRNAERDRLITMARWVLSAIAAGDITDVQARNAFGLNTTQWTALRMYDQDAR
jgi:hypothetical protein